MISVSDYLDAVDGHGVLATADGEGRVDVALYAKPHVVDENTIALIMADRLSYQNLESNPHAAYLFFQDGSNYTGVRLFLTKMKVESDKKKVDAIRRKHHPKLDGEEKYLVSFRIDRILPPVGPE